MSTEDNGEMGFPEMAMSSVSMFKSSPNPYFGSGWDPLISLSQSENFGGSSSNHHHHQAIGGFSHLVHYQSDSGLSEMVPKIPCFGSSRSFSEMVGLSDCAQITSNQNPEEGGSPLGNKKRRASDKSIEGDEQKEESSEQEEKKQNLSGKQIKDNSDSPPPPKENYIHVRAKRGQATNSHSLAERVRRERISERMRLLQELVPGCNKITGKAVMLDEIINYVQSLQQQVEFLSMKLATVNPEINIDMERILSKDIIHSRGSSASIHGFNIGLSSPHTYSHSTTQPFNPLTQIVWDNELQTLLQMGFDSNPNPNPNPNPAVVHNMGPNGRSKADL